MNRSLRRALLISCLVLCVSVPVMRAYAAPPAEHWVGTWAAAPFAANNVRRVRPAAGAANAVPAGAATTSAAAAPAPAAVGLSGDAAVPSLGDQMLCGTDTTFREIVHVSLGGGTVRVVLTNEFGSEPLEIRAAHVALSEGGSSISLATAAGLTFGGRASVTIPPGALAVSDAVTMKLPAGADLAVSLFIPAQPMKTVSSHGYADQSNYTAAGNVVGAKSLEPATEISSWTFLKGVDVKLGAGAGAIVAFGDSITDGAYATKNANARWPDVLAKRLQADKKTAELGVLNEGIGGNRVLHDNTGPGALARFDRDVIAQAGVKYVIVMESINDIGHAADPVKPYDVVSADDLIVALTQMAERAHTHGIKMIGATLTPYVGAKYASPAGDAMRQAVNKWIRTTSLLDGVIDFDKATQDPANPAMFLPAYDHGDHLHPGDAGYKAMGEYVDLKLFEK